MGGAAAAGRHCVCSNTLQCVIVCCSMLQCAVACCSVLQQQHLVDILKAKLLFNRIMDSKMWINFFEYGELIIQLMKLLDSKIACLPRITSSSFPIFYTEFSLYIVNLHREMSSELTFENLYQQQGLWWVWNHHVPAFERQPVWVRERVRVWNVCMSERESVCGHVNVCVRAIYTCIYCIDTHFP